MLKVLDLFSGIGGFSLGLERTGGFETVAFCECDPYAQKVLRKHWPNMPIYDDVRNFDGVAADVICGGYPCQPFSVAGKRGGQDDDRHLWPEMYRIIKTVRPRWVIAENVAGHINMGLDAVLSDLEAAGYTWWAFVIPACAIDARHRRDRVWIVANAKREQCGKRLEPMQIGRRERETEQVGLGGFGGHVPNANRPGQRASEGPRGGSQPSGAGYDIGRGGKVLADPKAGRLPNTMHPGTQCEAPGGKQTRVRPTPSGGDGPDPGRGSKPGLGGIADGLFFGMDPDRYGTPRTGTGIPDRVNRLKCLGNAVVPQIPEVIGYAILEAEACS
jgi:DNA (cytosine-5)-methyltransferase 1